jgi:tetratricopeptide (TPR) repeat protein
MANCWSFTARGGLIMKPSSRAAALVALVLAGAAWLWWKCEHDSAISFLPQSSGAYWILYPKPLDSFPHRVAPISTVFNHSFRVDRAPSNASISLRCFRSGNVSINGQAVPNLTLDSREWKKRRTVEIEKLLREGENDISVTVSNSTGPPALWLVLTIDERTLASDSTWDTSCLGAARQKAAFAFEPPFVRAGNPLFGRERVSDSLKKAWPALIALAFLSVLICGGMRWLASRESRIPWPKLRKEPGLGAIVVIVILLTILFINNLPQLASILGFDRDGHLQYVDYILQKKALPLADDGWQMYQPPLFYLLSALMLAPFDSSASTDNSILALRAFCAVISIVHVLLIFLCLRLLFPKQTRHQLIGLAIGAFLPASLCLAHNITNESLAALFVTASLYFTLRSIQSDSDSPRFHIAVGICLGLAMLTKFSALLAIPPICAALWWKGRQRALARNGNSPAKEVRVSALGLKPVLLVFVACVVVCGWHFGRVWAHFGNPLIGNWDPRLPFAWWQEPGYRMTGWYFRFGETFSTPLFSSTGSLTDGLYSTLWGDGLCSGSARMDFRPQWNYDLVNAGYLLALIPCALLLLGLVVSIVRLARKIEIEPFLSVSLVMLYGAGILYMTLQVPSFAQVKAFYALPALLPVCFLCVTGWDFLARRSAIWGSILSIGIVAWALTTYASLWIRPGNSFTHLVRGVGLADDKRYAEAIDEFSRTLRLAPDDVDAHANLLESLNRTGKREEAREEAKAAMKARPHSVGVEMQIGALLGLEGNYAEAVTHFREAARLAPDRPGSYLPLTTCLGRLGKMSESVESAREGLRVNPFDVDLHMALVSAYGALGDLTNEVIHLRIVTDLKPDRVEALNNLAWILASTSNQGIRNGPEAVRLAERACELTQRREPVLLGTLAAAYAAAGRFKEAVESAEQARDQAAAAGQTDVDENNRKLLELYRAGKDYREPGK